MAIRQAALPSAVTTTSMKETRGMDVKGLPSRWANGKYQAASVELKAEQFCLACQVKVQVGAVLGGYRVDREQDRLPGGDTASLVRRVRQHERGTGQREGLTTAAAQRIMDRGAIQRLLGLQADGLHARLPK